VVIPSFRILPMIKALHGIPEGSSIASVKTNSGQGQKGEVKGESAGTTTVTGGFRGDSATTDITVNP
jgi:hypothetical protein